MTSIGQEKDLEAEKLCQIIRDKEFEDQALIISKNYVRHFELDNAIDWALSRFSRDPNEFFHLGEDVYVWKMKKIMNFPEIRILFSYDEGINTITLLSMEELKDSE